MEAATNFKVKLTFNQLIHGREQDLVIVIDTQL